LQVILGVLFCTLLVSQQPSQVTTLTALAQPAPAAQPSPAAQPVADVPQWSASSQRSQAIRNAHTVYIASNTVFLTVGTLERALLKQKDWDKLNLNIVNDEPDGDLIVHVDRLIFTHFHTYVVKDRRSGIVLASGRILAFDGIVASGPMASQIVKILSAARLPAPTQGY